MFLVTLRDDLTAINRALDEAECARDRERQAECRERAILASLRAIDSLRAKPGLAEVSAAGREATRELEEAIAQTREDALLFEAFLAAEDRLFRDLGLDESTRGRLMASMREVHASSDWHLPGSERIDDGLERLREQLTAAREGLEDEEAHKSKLRLVRRGFLVVGGGFVLGANALVGLPTAPVTGGLSLVGAGVSVGLGSVMVDRGLP
jgi:hypothetical protein